MYVDIQELCELGQILQESPFPVSTPEKLKSLFQREFYQHKMF